MVEAACGQVEGGTMKKPQPDPIRFVKCPECGNEQADMGRIVRRDGHYVITDRDEGGNDAE